MMDILIVDDDPQIRTSLSGLLEDHKYKTATADSGEACLASLKDQNFDLIFLDIMMPGMNGLEVLEKIKSTKTDQKVMMMSGQTDIATAVEATKLGAINFLEKPLHPEKLLLDVQSIEQQASLEATVTNLQSRLKDSDIVIAESDAMLQILKLIDKVADSDARIFVTGENGTGKELIARTVHEKSNRATGPFVSLNCAAIPRDLVESELFGHEKGAFTGAINARPGKFEAANGGTLFLDEIGDMNLDVQAKLLRVLEENSAVRVGGNTPYNFDVRVLAATNKSIDEEIQTGKFREDLYYRLNVIPIHLPPLRSRPRDIQALAVFFLEQLSAQSGRGPKTWSAEALDALASYRWPGNVRELRNLVERIFILSEGSELNAADVLQSLPGASRDSSDMMIDNEALSFRERVVAFEKQLLMQYHQKTGGNISEMARQLKMDRANLHRKLRGLGM